MSTSEKILKYITQNTQASGKEIAEYLGNISSRAVRKQLKNLLDKGLVVKIGRPPKVFYLMSENKEFRNVWIADEEIRRIINDKYLFISPSGEAKYGWEGFVLWCVKTKQDPIKTAIEYVATLDKYDEFRRGDLVDGMYKMRNTFDEVFLDKLFYLDFYSIERFGKTKLGQLLLYAKQSQNKTLIRQLVDEIRAKTLKIVHENKIDGVLYVPPTVKREVQFMKELENGLNLPIKTLSVVKVKTEIVVPQKTLSKLEDRVENAKQTIIIDETGSYKNILLIDDAVGSGATFNETARQVRRKDIVNGKIIGLAMTGSFKGFDIISEV